MTWLILGSLVIGKVAGVTGFALPPMKLGFPLPNRSAFAAVLMAGLVAALGLTVALFVASEAFIDPELLGQAKMGALFSGFVGVVAIVIGRLAGIGRGTE